MSNNEKQPYFFNPGMTPEDLEDWLSQQKRHLASYNNLIKEKATLEERLKELNEAISYYSSSGFEDKQSFPWHPTPRPLHHQK